MTTRVKRQVAILRIDFGPGVLAYAGIEHPLFSPWIVVHGMDGERLWYGGDAALELADDYREARRLSPPGCDMDGRGLVIEKEELA